MCFSDIREVDILLNRHRVKNDHNVQNWMENYIFGYENDQAYLEDIVCSIPDHHNNENISTE